MRLIKYLKNFKAAVAVIACLLLVQAFADLALPKLTSQIVDVGIQQAGVEHAAAGELSASAFDKVLGFLSPQEADSVRACYEETDAGTYRLNERGERERARLDQLMAVPLVKAYGGDASNADLVPQQALAAARAEYELLGYDMGDMQMGYLVRTGLTMLAVAALGMAVSMAVGFVASRTGAKLGYQLRSRLFERVVHFSEDEVNRFSAASLITRGTNDIQLIQNVTIMLLRMVLYSPILAVGGIVMVTQTNASMGWIIVAAIAGIFVLLGVLLKVVMPKFRIMQKLIDRVNLVSREMLTGMLVVRAFDRQEHEAHRFDAASTDLMRTQLFTNRAMTFMMPCMTLIMNAVSVAIVWFGSHYVDLGAIQTGDLIAFITYSMVIIMSFLMIGMIAIMLPRADVAAQRVDEVLDVPLACQPAELPDAAASPGAASPHVPGDSRAEVRFAPANSRICGTGETLADSLGRTCEGVASGTCEGAAPVACGGVDGVEIRFEGVSFAYADSKECVLKEVSFTAQAGKTTAIVGGTGSGKSTILKLVECFHEVTEGAVLVDGVDVRLMPQRELRALLGYVPQQAFLFSGTIASNIAYSDQDMPRERVERAAAIAQAADFIAEKEEGYDSPVSQGGTNVSGGQRQRLAIARALATDARAFLFDDSFSALDYKTDALLRQQLAAQLAGRTVLIVAQRIATVMHADHIVVLDEGRVVGQGTHGQLMDACPEYREIALSQLSEKELREGGAR